MCSKKNIKELISLLEDLLGLKSYKKDNKIFFEEKNFKLSISMSELEYINHKISILNYKDSYILNNNYFEELLHVEGHGYYIREYFSGQTTLYDENGLIKYKLSEPSLEYILLSYIKMREYGIFNSPSLFLKKFYNGREYPNGHCSSYIQTKFKFLKLHKTLADTEDISPEFENIKIDDHLKKFIESQFNGIMTLKIISDSKTISADTFFDLADSFRFWINYHTQIAFIRPFEYIENSLELIKRIDKTKQIGNVPQKRYNKELLLYYELALSTNDPVFRFLSFYHILESFIGKPERKEIKRVMKKFLNEKDLKDGISGVDLSSYTHKFVTNNISSAETKLLTGSNANGKTKLLYCDYYNYLISEKVNFANADSLKDNNFIPSLSNRIYDVRNAIVHRKEGEFKYLNYKKEHQDQLKIELPLIRIVAEQFIINSSKDIE